MALLVWSAMFPFSTLLNYSFSQISFTAHCPLVIRTFLLTAFLVPYMVFVALPFLSRRFQKWLESNTDNPSVVETTYQQRQTVDTEKG
ncbi:hypothetical protein SAMN05216167_104153 [Spirosoma endophyticum]|uniref:Uncharacterized protein n=2 Tax=Spirosoma endophyticum TaxID=662367 RepID=A0A1I1QWP5_9BACT|nr:hypothetical protein SAMN05216167_104153 [Spirosoma endophyticum]